MGHCEDRSDSGASYTIFSLDHTSLDVWLWGFHTSFQDFSLSIKDLEKVLPGLWRESKQVGNVP